MSVRRLSYLLLALAASCAATDVLAHAGNQISCSAPTTPFSTWPSGGGSRHATLVTIKQVEKGNLKQDENGRSIPFGRWNSGWSAFKSGREAGDKIYEAAEIYSGPPNIFIHEFLLVRKGCVIRKWVADVLS